MQASGVWRKTKGGERAENAVCGPPPGATGEDSGRLAAIFLGRCAAANARRVGRESLGLHDFPYTPPSLADALTSNTPSHPSTSPGPITRRFSRRRSLHTSSFRPLAWALSHRNRRNGLISMASFTRAASTLLATTLAASPSSSMAIRSYSTAFLMTSWISKVGSFFLLLPRFLLTPACRWLPDAACRLASRVLPPRSSSPQLQLPSCLF